MKTNKFTVAIIWLVLGTMLPTLVIAQEAVSDVSEVASGARMSSFFNLVLLGTSAICIKQYFWPGQEYKIPFHIFNILFAIFFYYAGLSFLINHKEYYHGYDKLSSAGCIVKFFFSFNLYSLVQWIILFAVVLNVIYIIKYRKDFYKL